MNIWFVGLPSNAEEIGVLSQKYKHGLGLLASVGIILSPSVGAVLMSLITVVVAVNAQLLRRTDLATKPTQ